MSIIQEFKTFAIKGNVVDMAVGIVIGVAFGKIVSSLVEDVIMPPLGMIIGGVNFSDLAITLKAATVDSKVVSLRYGEFLQTVFDFLIVAFVIFMLVKAINTLKKGKEAAAQCPPTPPSPPAEERLLTEIRDLLRQKN